jgi:hypothetical protein
MNPNITLNELIIDFDYILICTVYKSVYKVMNRAENVIQI